ncbi:hypothetical protein NHP190012_15690 [Helicobacter sp. NHP19-012]|uniref:Large ribosomal subunit protein uL2 RNA-binding domain-containing protein n=1 Tax=Helicobacter gastrofelis TaxID=2849642 RepID=A0ABM7SJV5_9HELI|nr:hypothetical protein NHP190012_15690 [Helicobacter sp. NHP19-012]
MAIKTYKPYTPSRRFMSGLSSSDITAKASVKKLLVKLPAHAGRNNQGRITSRHKEAGAKSFIESLTSNAINSALRARWRRSNTILTATQGLP